MGISWARARRSRRGRRGALFALVILALVASISLAASRPGSSSRATVSPGPPWLSGIWLGGATEASEVEAFGRWRGSEVDTLTVYPAYATWKEIAESEWHVATFEGFEGRLTYGLPLLPSREEASLRDVAEGGHDDVWRAVAYDLVKHDRGDSHVRIGLEANGTWFSWGATAATAGDFKAAFRHVAGVMKAIAPDLEFVFDISCGVALTGAENHRLASLKRLYPGDDVVDVVGCDHYDSWSAVAHTEAEWADAITPDSGPGLTDVASFAREHGKKFAVPEWGLTSERMEGGGDNPFFIRKMHAFFVANKDVLAFENYFDEANTELGSSLYVKPQNPRSAAVYRQLW